MVNVNNTSTEDQTLIYFETFDNGSDRGGMAWDKWNVISLSPGDSHEYGSSYTTWEKRSDSWAYVTKYLVVSGASECYPLTIAANDANLALWEQQAQSLENPCQ